MSDVKQMATDDLKREFAEGLRITSERLTRMGAILVELESRGETVEADKRLLGLIRQIGRGELLVDVAVQFAGRPYVLAGAAKLSIKEQRKLLKEPEQAVARRFARNPSGGSRSQKDAPDLIAMAMAANVGDVAELCMRMVLASQNPKAVADKLLPQLAAVKTTRSQGLYLKAE